MLSAIGPAAARRFSSRGIAPSICRASSLVARRHAGLVVVPAGFRIAVGRRAFAAAAAKTTTRKTTTTTKKSAAATKPTAKADAKSKKPAAKKTTKTKTKTKTAAKKAAKPKAKAKTKAKPAPKRKPAKLTPEQKDRAEVRELKKTALLKEPHNLPDTPWILFMATGMKKVDLKGGEDTLGSVATRLSAEFKNLSSSELQALQQSAEKNKQANRAAYKAWVESHTAEEIHDANRARSRLRRVFQKGPRNQIQDERQPKRASGPYTLFTKSRWASGDLGGRPAVEAARLIASEWKVLSNSDKQPYQDLAKAELDRYVKEMKSVLNRDVKLSA